MLLLIDDILFFRRLIECFLLMLERIVEVQEIVTFLSVNSVSIRIYFLLGPFWLDGGLPLRNLINIL
jgi:hypothetical protein